MSESRKETDLVHLIYSSAETVEFSRVDIVYLLKKARDVNFNLGVTGMLLYENGAFFQVLEGPSGAVGALYQKIENDKRHRRITKIIQEPIAERSFSSWTMGYSGVTAKELREINGMNDFFHKERHFTELDEGRAKTLLEAFKDGRWRSTLR